MAVVTIEPPVSRCAPEDPPVFATPARIPANSPDGRRYGGDGRAQEGTPQTGSAVPRGLTKKRAVRLSLACLDLGERVGHRRTCGPPAVVPAERQRPHAPVRDGHCRLRPHRARSDLSVGDAADERGPTDRPSAAAALSDDSRPGYHPIVGGHDVRSSRLGLTAMNRVRTLPLCRDARTSAPDSSRPVGGASEGCAEAVRAVADATTIAGRCRSCLNSTTRRQAGGGLTGRERAALPVPAAEPAAKPVPVPSGRGPVRPAVWGGSRCSGISLRWPRVVGSGQAPTDDDQCHYRTLPDG
jgi:hypothetical protein